MRIFHRDTNQVFDDIEIFLTLEEANELSGRLEGLVKKPSAHHIHLDTDFSNGAFQKELIIAIISKENMDHFDKRSKEVILKDK